jgi:PKD repeat protein
MKKILVALLIYTCSAASIVAQPVANFSGSPTTLCAGKSVSWTNLSTGITDSTNYVWSFPGSTNPTDANRNPDAVQYNVPGTYSVSLTVSTHNGTDTKTKTNYISVLPLPIITVTPPAGYLGCNITSVTFTAQGGNKYLWAPTTNLSVAPGGLAIANPPTNVTYTVMGMSASGCISPQKTVPVYFNTSPPPPAGAITGGPTTVCAGQTVGTYSVPSTGPVSPYKTWTGPPGSVITSGQGTGSVKITFGNISGDICCTASNACGSATPTCEAITVNPTPVVESPGTITGLATACANTGVVYTIDPVANALTYNWSATGGANITAGQGTNTVTVVFSTNNSDICVRAINSCNISEPSCRNITVFSSTPAIPGAITGPTTVCNMQSGVNYSIAAVSNATVYIWTVPAGASIASGQGTRAIKVNFGSASGTVCVTAGNGCGTSLPNCIPVSVDPNPSLGII